MTCPCGFAATYWNRDTHIAHKAQHVAVFPDSDPHTIDALDQNIRRAPVPAVKNTEPAKDTNHDHT